MFTGLSSWRIFSKILSCLVWFLWWLRQGAIGPIEATLFRVTVDWPDFWIYTFELEIRLKWNSWPFCSAPFLWCPAGPLVPGFLAEILVYHVKLFGTVRNSVFTAASACEMKHDMNDKRQQACPFPAGVVSLVSGEVKHIVHLIRWNLKSRYMPSGLTWLPSRQGNNARPLGILGLSPCLGNCFGCFTLVTN